ncbi:TRAP-type C4-dicarboxylate transport system, small permease component [Sanguibacter gelidistatuariae]|uniref:TRAP-type C4-dicarboxylate transport system, small permease component n=1 Tax=Sanguibacter gelidistatuariae TaxID=1814289 RepID=A0A1G6V2J6_9MICO|nr:TRAP transporter small permease [Sanguibacter gelidistatuariae]SDD47145.1 TRAP-type C4-dicarboxylate transport system, small permease component [Sanguibacter gelidistatuariae]
MKTVKKGLDSALSWFCVVLFAVLVVDVSWQVFSRQVLNSPSGWSEELAKYVFIWLGLFGSALVFGERGHIYVDFAVRKLPAKIQYVVGLLMQVAILAFASLVLVYGGWQVAQLSWDQKLAGLPIDVGPLYLALPISGVLIIFYTIYHLVAILLRVENAVEDAEPDVL